MESDALRGPVAVRQKRVTNANNASLGFRPSTRVRYAARPQHLQSFMAQGPDSSLIRIALDCSGGDHGAASALDGATRAVESADIRAEQVLLVGDPEEIQQGLAARGCGDAGFEIVGAPDRLTGRETPVEALRKFPRNSASVCVGLVKERAAHGLVSAGNTGLVVASATLGLRCLEGIRRPGIAVTIRGERGPFTVIDVGANPQPKAAHLHQYALMGAAYVHDTFGVERPRVGLMNIGSEDAKGHPLVREARALLEADHPNFDFVGNVEGVDVFSGVCDVIVCDGFTGNVLLKVSEGCAEYVVRRFAGLMHEEGVAGDLQKRVLGRIQQDVEFSEYGGALLLGVEGIVTICHGRSQGPAIANALRVAVRAVGARVNEHIVAAARIAADTA